MTISRYRIRNECRLADPALYQAVDQDDSDAVLEGVSMASLVGILRQLGDLAEFAAEIFHGLHEEVMATADRGHDLMFRIQQLESEFSSIEKTFLSQTSHSQFSNNPGVDWHADLKIYQSLVAQGELPQFIMRYYEACHGPPRLFLLDKYDIAGAGTCLKRYSDPSFFRMECAPSGTMETEIQRGKKAYKIKKNGSQWRNRDTLEILFRSHSNSRSQLASDENRNNSEDITANGVKLKKRYLNDSSFNSKTRDSYMERILKMDSPEWKIICENSENPSHSKTKSSDAIESFPEQCVISTVDSAKRQSKIKKMPVLFPDRQEVLHLPSDGTGEDIVKGGNVKPLAEQISKYEVDDMQPTLDLVKKKDALIDDCSYVSDKFEVEKFPATIREVGRKDAFVDGESKMEASADGYRSDDAAKEMENDVDVIATTEPEMEMDTERRANYIHSDFSNVASLGMESNEEHEDSLPGTLSPSCDWNCSFKKLMSGHSSLDSLNKLATMEPSQGNLPENLENSLKLEDGIFDSLNENLCCDHAENPHLFSYSHAAAKIHYASSKRLSSRDEVLGAKSSALMVCNGTDNKESKIQSGVCEIRKTSFCFCMNESISTLNHSSPSADRNEIQLPRADPDEVSATHLEAHATKSSFCVPCGPDMSWIPSQANDGQIMASMESFPSGQASAKVSFEVSSDISFDASLHSSDVLDLHLGKKDKDVLEKTLGKGHAEDISFDKSSTFRTTDSNADNMQAFDTPAVSSEAKNNSVLDDDHRGYVEGNPIIEDVMNKILDLSKSKTSLAKGQGQLNSLKIEDPEYCSIAGTVPLELANSFDAGYHVEVPRVCSEMETLLGRLEASDTLEVGVKEMLLPKGNHPNSFPAMEYVADNASLPYESLKSDSLLGLLPAEFKMQSNDLVPGSVLLETVHDNHVSGLIRLPIKLQTSSNDLVYGCKPEETDCNIHGCKLIDPSKASEDYIQLQEEPLCSEPTPCQPSNLDDPRGMDAQAVSTMAPSESKSKRQVVSHIDLTPEPYNPDFSHLCFESRQFNHHSASGENIQIDLQHYNSSEAPTMKKNDNGLNSKSPPRNHLLKSGKDIISPSFHFLPKLEIPSEQVAELQADAKLNTVSGSGKGLSPESFDHQFEQAKSPEQLGLQHSVVCPPGFHCEPLDPEMQINSNGVVSNGFVDQLGLSSLATPTSTLPELEASIPFLPYNNFEKSKPLFGSSDSNIFVSLPPLFPTLSPLIPEGTHQQSFFQLPDMPTLDLPASGSHALESSLENVPPLPPLPPLEWRMGKLRFCSVPTTEGMEPQEGSLTLVEEKANCLSSSKLLSTIKEKIQHNFSSLGVKIEQPSNMPWPMSNIGDERPQHDFISLGGDVVHQSDVFVPFPTTESEKPQVDFVPAAGEMPAPLNSFKALPTICKEKLQHDLLSLEQVVLKPQNTFTILTSVEDDKPRTLEGEEAEPQKQLSLRPTMVDRKANGNLQIKHSHSGDPLIEAVSAHNRTTLGKVSKWVQPVVRPKTDERNSLLEQIRMQSFKLKPPVVKKPVIVGPKTNLNVVAILEKASAIRQAFMGSDDDEDSWSEA